jgi:ERCC4-related helicase
VNPLDALREALNGDYSHNDTLFYPPRDAENTEAVESGSRPAKSTAKGKNRQEWFRFFGLTEEDSDNDLLEAFRMTITEVEKATDKQILAFTNLVAPSEEVYNRLMTKGDNYLKQVLDEKLGSRK